MPVSRPEKPAFSENEATYPPYVCPPSRTRPYLLSILILYHRNAFRCNPITEFRIRRRRTADANRRSLKRRNSRVSYQSAGKVPRNAGYRTGTKQNKTRTSCSPCGIVQTGYRINAFRRTPPANLDAAGNNSPRPLLPDIEEAQPLPAPFFFPSCSSLSLRPTSPSHSPYRSGYFSFASAVRHTTIYAAFPSFLSIVRQSPVLILLYRIPCSFFCKFPDPSRPRAFVSYSRPVQIDPYAIIYIPVISASFRFSSG